MEIISLVLICISKILATIITGFMLVLVATYVSSSLERKIINTNKVRRNVMANKLINTSECEKCIHSTLIEETKGKLYIDCDVKKNRLFYGQYIPCDDFDKKGK